MSDVQATGAEDNAPAIISDHPFDPREEWFTTCRVCGLAMAAHETTAVLVRPSADGLLIAMPRVRVNGYAAVARSMSEEEIASAIQLLEDDEDDL